MRYKTVICRNNKDVEDTIMATDDKGTVTLRNRGRWCKQAFKDTWVIK